MEYKKYEKYETKDYKRMASARSSALGGTTAACLLIDQMIRYDEFTGFAIILFVMLLFSLWWPFLDIVGSPKQE